MPVSAMTFQPESFQQANPFLTGLSASQDIYAKGVQNQFMGPLYRQQLLNSQLNNQVLGAQAPYAGQQAAANVALTQAQAPYLQAQTGYVGANANLIQQQTPYAVLQARINAMSDPILKRNLELQIAQQGYIDPAYLAQSGFSAPPGAGTWAQMPPMPGGMPQQGGMNPGMPQQPGMGMPPQMPGQMPGQMPQGMPGQQQSGNPILGGPPAPQTLPAAPGNVPMTPAQQQRYQQLVQMGALNQLPGAQGQQPGQPQQVANIPGANSPTTAPNAFGGSPQQNWALFGTPYNPLQYNALNKQMQTQAQTGVTQYNAALEDAAKGGSLGVDMNSFAKQFKNAYDKSSLTGPLLGKAATSGWEAIPSVVGKAAFGQGDLSPEQAADNASQNLAAIVAKTIAGGRVTNSEMQFVQNLKPNRAMTPQTAKETVDFLQQKAIRLQEEQPFLNAAKNNGVDVQTAQSLWNKYNNQRPVYDFNNKKPFTQFQNSWQDYLNPQAVQAAQTGAPYMPIPKFDNGQQYAAWQKSLSPADKLILRQQLQAQAQQ